MSSPTIGWRPRLAEVAGAIRWYARGVVGADAYERYLAHQARVHPGRPVLDRREFWRAKYAEQDVNPGTRCC